jgi:hypothetical protein
MPMTPMPTPPSRSMTPSQFNTAMDNFLAWLPVFQAEVNAIGTPGLGGGTMTGDLGLATEVTIASAATCDIGALASNKVAISGTTTITSFGTVANRWKKVRFTGAMTLTHHATSLILNGADIKTASGDTAEFTSDVSGNWRLRQYRRNKKCAFSARMNTTAASVTGDGTQYTIVWDTEVFDVGADFSSTTFTAPFTGLYQLNAHLTLTGAAAAHTTVLFEMNASTGPVPFVYGGDLTPDGSGRAPLAFSELVFLNAGNTVTVKITVSGSTKVVGVYGESGNSASGFSGHFIGD